MFAGVGYLFYQAYYLACITFVWDPADSTFRAG